MRSETVGVGMLWVGDDPNPVPYVRGANVGSREAMPLRIIPDLGQVSENSAKPSSTLACNEVCDVLHDEEARSKLASEAEEFAP